MPRYRVTEIRARKASYLIDAEDEAAAEEGRGERVAEGGDTDDYRLVILNATRRVRDDELDPEDPEEDPDA